MPVSIVLPASSMATTKCMSSIADTLLVSKRLGDVLDHYACHSCALTDCEALERCVAAERTPDFFGEECR